MYDHPPGLAGKAYAPTFALIVVGVVAIVLAVWLS
jgi:hypothetical protein